MILKHLCFQLDELAVTDFFSPIRDKRKLIETLIRAVKYMLINPVVENADVKGEMCLYIDKMSRLFFFSESKFFSFNFPFQVCNSEDGVVFYSKHVDDLNSRVTSQILNIVCSDEIYDASCVFEFSDKFLDAVEYSEELWRQFIDLLKYEDGYIRFDHDPDNENGNLHPLNHLDVFYSNVATFKLGINSKFSKSDLIDLVNINTPCSFLAQA